jgi:hypothetical protein
MLSFRRLQRVLAEGCPERFQHYQVKQHAVYERRRCGLNSMFKAPRDWERVSKPIRPKRSVNIHNTSYWEDGDWPKLLVLWKAKERMASMIGRRGAPPPCIECRQDKVGSNELTVEISLSGDQIGWIDHNQILENHKSAGACREVRVIHSSQRTGKLFTRRRGDRSLDVRRKTQ